MKKVPYVGKITNEQSLLTSQKSKNNPYVTKYTKVGHSWK